LNRSDLPWTRWFEPKFDKNPWQKV
jgi:hypothetical protein